MKNMKRRLLIISLVLISLGSFCALSDEAPKQIGLTSDICCNLQAGKNTRFFLLSKGETPKASFSSDGGYIYGLKAAAKYSLKDSNALVIEKTSDSGSRIYADSDLYGKKIISITLLSDGVNYSDSDPQNLSTGPFQFLASRQETPTASYDPTSDLLTGLKISASYRLFLTDGTKLEFSPASASYSLASESDGFGKELSYLICLGDKTTVCDSLSQPLSGLILPRKAAPTAAFNKITGNITGLIQEADYSISFSDGTSGNFVSDDSGIISSIVNSSQLLGKTIVSLVASGDSVSYIDSLPQAQLTWTIPAQIENVGTPSFRSSDGEMIGLKAGGVYLLRFSDGTTKEIIADDNGLCQLIAIYSIVGKTLIGIQKKGDGISTISSEFLTISPVVIIRKPLTPNGTFETGTISGLEANGVYVLFDESGTSYVYQADKAGYIFATSDSRLLGKTVTSIYQRGDGVVSDDSPSQKTEWKISGQQCETPTGFFSQISGYLSGLSLNSKYYIQTADGKIFQASSDAEGRIDISSISALIGKSISGLIQIGDDEHCDSQTEAIQGEVILAREDRPTGSFVSPYISNLKPNSDYSLLDCDGDKINLVSDASGVVFIPNFDSLIGKTIVALTASGNQKNTIDSLAQTVSWLMPSYEATPDIFTIKYDSGTKTLSGLVYGSDYVLSFSDGSVVNTKSGTDSGAIDLSLYSGQTLYGIRKKGDGKQTVDSKMAILNIRITPVSAQVSPDILILIIMCSVLAALFIAVLVLFILWRHLNIKLPKPLLTFFHSISRMVFHTDKSKPEQQAKEK
jgi:hypothetical protein